MSEEEEPVPLIRGSGKDPPFTFALAVMKFPYLCRLPEGRRYLGLIRLNTVMPCGCRPYSLFFLFFFPDNPADKSLSFLATLHPPAQNSKYFSENMPISCFDRLKCCVIELCSFRFCNSSSMKRPVETLRPSQTRAGQFGRRWASKLNLTCTHLQSNPPLFHSPTPS